MILCLKEKWNIRWVSRGLVIWLIGMRFYEVICYEEDEVKRKLGSICC